MNSSQQESLSKHRTPVKGASVLLIIILVIMFATGSQAVAAPVVIDPDLGWDGWFYWDDGLGQIDDISQTPGVFDNQETEWSLTLASPGNMTLVTADDGFSLGDEFALYVDNALVPWTSESYNASGYYHGEYENLSFSAGTHSITLYVTVQLSGFTENAAMVSFSPVVPEPATMSWLALGGLALIKRRRP